MVAGKKEVFNLYESSRDVQTEELVSVKTSSKTATHLTPGKGLFPPSLNVPALFTCMGGPVTQSPQPFLGTVSCYSPYPSPLTTLPLWSLPNYQVPRSPMTNSFLYRQNKMTNGQDKYHSRWADAGEPGEMRSCAEMKRCL